MSAAAAAAAAAAAVAAAGTAAGAAAASPTRYERSLLSCARALSDFAGCTEPGVAWDEELFREWAREHRVEATKQAGLFMAQLLRDKAANQSVGYTARLHVAAWKAYGVSVDQSVLDELSRLTRERWRPATLSRLSALEARKSQQYDLLDQHWGALIEYLGDTAGEQFAEDCRAAQPSQPTSIACELAYLSRKSVQELEQALLRTRALASVLRCTGMRSITAVTLRVNQFTEAGSESGALLLKRMERKCGSARNVQKPVYACIVAHADPRLCAIVHIAAALGDREMDPAYELFAEGFTHKPRQDYVSFATLLQRRYTAILQAAAFALGVPLFAEKKLHAFRVMCTNALGSTGASEAEREAHIGWQSTVQSRHYSSLRHTALNARTAHLLAGRSGRDDPPHPMWQCLAQAPGDGYWQRVRCLAIAAGYLAGPVVEPQFEKLVRARVAAGNPEREDSATYLLKRVKQLERENAALQVQVQVVSVKKRRRPEDAAAELKELVSELKQAACSADFPAQCAAALDRISALIEDASDRGSFGLAQSTAEGRALVRILVLAALTNKHGPGALQPHGAPGRSWLAWAADAAHPLVAAISTKTWPAYKASASAALQAAAVGPLPPNPLNLTAAAAAEPAAEPLQRAAAA